MLRSEVTRRRKLVAAEQGAVGDPGKGDAVRGLGRSLGLDPVP